MRENGGQYMLVDDSVVHMTLHGLQLLKEISMLTFSKCSPSDHCPVEVDALIT